MEKEGLYYANSFCLREVLKIYIFSPHLQICVENCTYFFKPTHRLRGHQQEHFDKLVTGEILDREDFKYKNNKKIKNTNKVI